MKPIAAINDFVVKFANVNGSGSASANELFAKAILRMGVPVSPRNIFPSNIQGLPTWYEVRVNEKGHLGRRGGVDLMVAMNPQTWDADLKEIEPGGYLFYDSTKPLPKSKFRDDVQPIGVPLTEICNRTYTDARQRQLFKNIMYIGALSALLEIDIGVIEKLLGEQYKGKEKLLDANKQALHLGRDYVLAESRASARHPGAPCRRGRRSHLRRRQHRGRARLRLRRRDGLRVVSDHAVVVARRGVPEVLPEAARRSGHRQAPLRDRAGRGRDRLDRHDRRRRLERRARVHDDVGPRHLADDRVHRPRLFRRDSDHDHRRAARRPVDRHADAHAAGRHHFLRICLARRHQARAAVSRRSARVLRVRRAGARSRRPPADADLRHDRSRHRHEPAPGRAVRVGRIARLRPRQGHDRRGARSRQGFRPLQGRRRRRHSVSHVSRHASRRAARISRAARRAIRTRAIPSAAPTTSTTWSGC